MANTKQAPRGTYHLEQAIPGYKGYSHSKSAHKTDRIFSEEVLSKLSETVATVSRIKRVASAELNPGVLGSLDVIEEKAESLAQVIAETAFEGHGGQRSLEREAGSQMAALDASIIERVGHVNQALAAIDLEGGAGLTSDDVDSVSDLLDDLKNSIKRRESILNSRLF